MIARITGTLVDLDPETYVLQVEAGALVYEVHAPGYAVSDISRQMNRPVTLHTLEVFEESGKGNSLIPRMIGFPQKQDKQFFQRFISVKGIGVRKALRAMARPLVEIACAIERADAKMLATLPEIGKRTAEQIIAELKGKMSDFAAAGYVPGAAGPIQQTFSDIELEALEILLQLGERRADAEELIAKVRASSQGIQTTDALVQAVYKAKARVL